MGMRPADTNNIVHIQKREKKFMKTQRPVSLVDPHHQEDTALHRSGYVLCLTSVRSSVCLRIAHVHQQRPIVEGAVERWGGQKHISHCGGGCREMGGGQIVLVNYNFN